MSVLQEEIGVLKHFSTDYDQAMSDNVRLREQVFYIPRFLIIAINHRVTQGCRERADPGGAGPAAVLVQAEGGHYAGDGGGAGDLGEERTGLVV